jgi:peptidoglycan/LPS O-acetylase OafA/YrhL
MSLQTGDPNSPGGFTHTPALDGVRGLAILLVLFFHLFWSNSRTGSRLFDLLNQVRSSSYIGVNLFFVLSGFLITGVLLDTLHVPHFFKTFYARRALRIFPLYYGVLVVLLLLTRPLHLLWNGWQYYLLTYTSNLPFWRPHPLYLPHFNINHFWSLQVEEQFYLIWPFLVFRLKRPQSLIRISLLGCGLALLIRIVLVALRPQYHALHLPYWAPYSTTFSCADNLLYGCVLCALLRTAARERVLQLAPRVFALAAATLLIAAIVYRGLAWETNLFVPTIGFTVIGISCAALIAMALRPASTTQRIFQNSTLRFFGKYSYGLYVFHYSLDAALTGPIRRFVDAHQHSKAVGVLVGACVVLAASIIVALLSYHFFESPFLKLKRFFAYNRNTGTAAPEAPRHSEAATVS